MLYLAICIVTTTCFGLCYKFANRRECYVPLVQLTMFTTCSALSMVCAMVSGGIVFQTPVVVSGVLAGIFMAVAVSTFFDAMRQGGLAVGWTCVNFGVALPLVASIVVWKEIPSLLQCAGLLLLPPCILLLADRKHQVSGSLRRWTLLVGLSTASSGVSQLMAKVINVIVHSVALDGVDGGQIILSYVGFAYGTGALILLVLMRGGRRRWTHVDMASGVFMGLFALAATWSLIRSLDFLPGVVVFPAKAACSVALTALLAVLFWRESLTKRQICGITAGALCTVFLNL